MTNGPLDALRVECELVSQVVLTLPEESFTRPTRCPAWNVKELLGHMYRDVDRTNTGLAAPAPERTDTDSVSYWRSYDRVGDAPSIADHAVQIADSFETGAGLADAWDQMWRRALDQAARADPSRPIVSWGPVLTLDEYLRTRVLEITVHGTDLADALGREPWATTEGLRITNDILRGLLEATVPGELGWSEVAFMERGTGRALLTPQDRDTLGPMAERFPLLG